MKSIKNGPEALIWNLECLKGLPDLTWARRNGEAQNAEGKIWNNQSTILAFQGCQCTMALMVISSAWNKKTLM